MIFYFFVGTIAELIKMMPVIKEFSDRGATFKIIASGQNIILNNEIFRLIKIQNVDIVLSNINIKQSAIGLLSWFLKILIKGFIILGREFGNAKKDNIFIMVHGDTVSTLMGAIFGKFFKVNVVHIEAGLRSFNYFHPFPEEICRTFVSRLATVHFCPNQWSIDNLANRNGDKINTFHNTLIDSLAIAVEHNAESQITRELMRSKYYIFILHRQENLFNSKLVHFLIREIISIGNELKCVFIMHQLTAVTIEKLRLMDHLRKNNNVVLAPRLPYVEFMELLNGCEYIMTDGGSNQEESFYLGKPCLILREASERIEGLKENVVLSKNDMSIIKNFTQNYKNYQRPKLLPQVRPSKIIADHFLRCEC